MPMRRSAAGSRRTDAPTKATALAMIHVPLDMSTLPAPAEQPHPAPTITAAASGINAADSGRHRQRARHRQPVRRRPTSRASRWRARSTLASSEPTLLHNISPVRVVAWPHTRRVGLGPAWRQPRHRCRRPSRRPPTTATVHASGPHHASATAPQRRQHGDRPPLLAGGDGRQGGGRDRDTPALRWPASRRVEASSARLTASTATGTAVNVTRATMPGRSSISAASTRGEHHDDRGDRPGETVAQQRRDLCRLGVDRSAPVFTPSSRREAFETEAARGSRAGRGTRLGL